MILELGSTKIIKTSFENTKTLYDSIFDKLITVTNQSNKIPQFIVNGSCSFHNVEDEGKELYKWKELEELIDVLKDSLREYIDLLGMKEEDFSVAGMWANRYPPGTYVDRHNHNYLNPDVRIIIDALFYLRKDEDSGSLYIDIPDYGVYNTEMNEGDVIIFQSSLDHWTDINKGKTDKYVIGLELVSNKQGLRLNEI